MRVWGNGWEARVRRVVESVFKDLALEEVSRIDADGEFVINDEFVVRGDEG